MVSFFFSFLTSFLLDWLLLVFLFRLSYFSLNTHILAICPWLPGKQYELLAYHISVLISYFNCSPRQCKDLITLALRSYPSSFKWHFCLYFCLGFSPPQYAINIVLYSQRLLRTMHMFVIFVFLFSFLHLHLSLWETFLQLEKHLHLGQDTCRPILCFSLSENSVSHSFLESVGKKWHLSWFKKWINS